MKRMVSKIKEFVKTHEASIVLGIGVVLVSLISFAAGYLVAREQLKEPIQLEKNDLIRLSSPKPGQAIQSPALVQGLARGYWFFEASFPVKIYDGNNVLLGIGVAQAAGEWMTEEFVPFQVTMEFETPTTKEGTLVLEKDNPSGLPEHADELRVPIRFGGL